MLSKTDIAESLSTDGVVVYRLTRPAWTSEVGAAFATTITNQKVKKLGGSIANSRRCASRWVQEACDVERRLGAISFQIPLRSQELLVMRMLRAAQELHPESLHDIAKHVWRTLLHFPYRGGTRPLAYGRMDAF